MIIKLSPAGINLPFEVLRAGDVLTLNGARFDLSQLPEGATLPLEAFPEPHFAGDAQRVDGELHVVLRLPYPPGAGEAVRWPEPIIDPADGRVPLPTDGLPDAAVAPETWPHSDASIDWTLVITREGKEQAATAARLAAVVADAAFRRAAADAAIAPLQDAVDLDDVTDAELLSLKAWKKYRVALSRLHEQPGYPTDIDWPAPPA